MVPWKAVEPVLVVEVEVVVVDVRVEVIVIVSMLAGATVFWPQMPRPPIAVGEI